MFAGLFCAKAEESIQDGCLVIGREGTGKKFLKRVQQVSFSGKYAKGQEVLYVTERCVFRLLDGKMVLTEIAPGADLQRDILDQMDLYRPFQTSCG